MKFSVAYFLKLSVEKEGKLAGIKFIAKDGIDLPPIQQTSLNESAFFGFGETADFMFKPLQAGIYNLHVIIADDFGWSQKWVVTDK